MPSININQFDGSSYQQLLPKSQASQYRYEGNIQKIGHDNISDQDFVAALDEVFSAMPSNSCRNLLWQDHPLTGGATYFGALCKTNNNYGVLISYSYVEASWLRIKYNGVWKEFKQMALLDSNYLKTQSTLSINNLSIYVNRITKFNYIFKTGSSISMFQNAYNKNIYFGTCKSPCMYKTNNQWKLGFLFTPTKKYLRNEITISTEVTFPVGTFVVLSEKSYNLNQEQIIFNEDVSMGITNYQTFKIRAANSNSYGYYWSFYHYYDTSDGQSSVAALLSTFPSENGFTTSYSLSTQQQLTDYIDGFTKISASVFLLDKITS